MKKLMILTTVFIFSGCCSDSKPEPEKVVSMKFYLANEVVRLKKLKHCEASLENQATLNCMNAIKAKKRLEIKMLTGF